MRQDLNAGLETAVVVSDGASRADRLISVVAENNRWAIKHGEGYLGFVASFEDALSIARQLSN
jgi:hypothetical protein